MSPPPVRFLLNLFQHCTFCNSLTGVPSLVGNFSFYLSHICTFVGSVHMYFPISCLLNCVFNPLEAGYFLFCVLVFIFIFTLHQTMYIDLLHSQILFNKLTTKNEIKWAGWRLFFRNEVFALLKDAAHGIVECSVD